MKSPQCIASGLFLLLAAGVAYSQAGGTVTFESLSIDVTVGDPNVKGVPFSAEFVDETTRVLGPDNRITQETHGKMFRDSEGRTRLETELMGSTAPGKSQVVFIADPVDQMRLTLYPERKIGSLSRMKQALPSDRAGDAKQPETKLPRAGKVERLGTKEIEGYVVFGMRYTLTLDAGTVGNEKSISSVHERWYSPDLKMTLLTITDDPQHGQTTRRVMNIHTDLPDPLLFQAPEDYTVRDDSIQK